MCFLYIWICVLAIFHHSFNILELQIHKTKCKCKQLWEYVPKIQKTETVDVNFKIGPTYLLVWVWKVEAQKRANKHEKPHTVCQISKEETGSPGFIYIDSSRHIFSGPLSGDIQTLHVQQQHVHISLRTARWTDCSVLPCKTGNRLLFLKRVPAKRTRFWLLGRNNRRGLWVTQPCWSLNGLMGRRIGGGGANRKTIKLAAFKL